MMNELLSRLSQYLDGGSDLEAFEIWFYDLAFDIERQYTGDVVDLVHEIEGILAEASSGYWSEAVLRNELESSTIPYRNPRAIQFQWIETGKKEVRSSSLSPILAFAGKL